MTETRIGIQKYAGLAVRLAAVWLLTGALFKLFAGDPKMLPGLVRDHSPFSWTLTFQLAIAIELALVCIAVLKPHLGWMLITALFGFFMIVLADQQLKGAESCGCLGEKIKVPPLVMMGIDGALLAFILATKPWKSLAGPGLSTPILVLGVAASIAAPWIVIERSVVVAPAAPVAGTEPNTPTRALWIEMDPSKWVGKSIFDVDEFTKWVPAEKIPTDGRIVLWRQACDHCAQHLREMANEKDESQSILLVQVMDDLKSTRSVDAMPNGANVTQFQLPAGEGLFTTPVEIRVEGGVVKATLYEEDFAKARGG